jgi:hypothetical protein
MRSLVAIAVLASAAALFAQDEKQVQDAIKGLGSESFEEREKATADLRKIGGPALAALKKAAADSDDPEVRARAKRLLEEIERAGKRDPVPGRRPGVVGTVIHKSDKEILYTITPASGDSITFHKMNDGRVKLEYPDGKGGRTAAESDSIDKFVAENKDLAATYGITKDGIEYGGTRMSFTAKFPELKFRELPWREVPMPRTPEFKELDDLFGKSEELRKAFESFRAWRTDPPDQWWRSGAFDVEVARGAQLGPVPGVLRTQLAIPEGQGVVVESVREGSTAAAAGLKRHDVILEIDGTKVTGPADVRALLKRDSTVKALRGGKEETLQPAPAKKKEY